MNTLWGKRADWNVPFQGPSIWLLRVGGRADMKIWIEEFFSQTSGDRIFSPDVHRCRIFFQTYTTLKIFFFHCRNFFPSKSVCRTFFCWNRPYSLCTDVPPPWEKNREKKLSSPDFFLRKGDVCTQVITHTFVPPSVELKVKWSVTY